jgi:hypothetical protein
VSRHSSGSAETALAEGIFALVLLVAAVIIILLVYMVSELYRIFRDHVHNSKASRILWGALAGLLSILLLAGILATNPDLAPLGLAIGAWALFAFSVVCELTDWYYRRKEVPVALPAALSDVVS